MSVQKSTSQVNSEGDFEESYPFELNFAPPKTLGEPLWRSLIANIRDQFSPETLPPLLLTSRPVDIGMLAGDILSLPWYRTIFTNLGDVISPETLPPLELESRPVDVGELIGDQLNHMWWKSLLRNLADAAAPERQAPLQLTSTPGDPHFSPGSLLLVHWSAVIDGPKAHLPLKPKLEYAGISRSPITDARPKLDAGELEFIHGLEIDLRRDLRRSRFRQRIWVGLATAQVGLLIAGFFWK